MIAWKITALYPPIAHIRQDWMQFIKKCDQTIIFIAQQNRLHLSKTTYFLNFNFAMHVIFRAKFQTYMFNFHNFLLVNN